MHKPADVEGEHVRIADGVGGGLETLEAVGNYVETPVSLKAHNNIVPTANMAVTAWSGEGVGGA